MSDSRSDPKFFGDRARIISVVPRRPSTRLPPNNGGIFFLQNRGITVSQGRGISVASAANPVTAYRWDHETDGFRDKRSCLGQRILSPVLKSSNAR